MNVKVKELMTESVVTTQPHATLAHVRGMLEKNKIGALPVVDSEGSPVGIVSAADLIGDLKPGSPVSSVMTEKVYCVPQYDEVSVAARVMRNHKIHRVVVTHEQKVVGMLSSFDLLKLVEGHRFVAKNAPTPSRKASKRS
ncbi:MAG: CBS domain-containing protein [Myxococcales bacterium]|nr:CBS domain-containing protein [Myxococcales bacterium]